MPAEIPRPSRDELRAMIVGGMSRKSLAMHFGVGTATISRWKRSHGLHGATLPPIAQDESGQAVVNVTPSARAFLAANPFGIGL